MINGKIGFVMTSRSHWFNKTNESLQSFVQCLKIAQKVAFNIASEASYVYIVSGQKLVKNTKNSFWRVFENLQLAVKQCYQTGHFE